MVARPPRAQVDLVGMAVALVGPMGVPLGGVAAMVLEAAGLVALVALGVLGSGCSKVVRQGVPMAGLRLRVDMEGLSQPQVEPHTVAHQEGAMGAPRFVGVAGADRPLSNRGPQGATVARHSSSSSPSHSGDR